MEYFMKKMIQSLSKLTAVIFLISLFSLSAVSAQSAPKFGHIDSNELLKIMPEFDAALTKLEELKTSQNEKLTMMQQEFQKQMQNYQETQAALNPEARAIKEKELQQMQSNIEAYYQQGMQELQAKETELTRPVVEKARLAVEEVGKENGFLYIFDKSKGAFVFNSVNSIDVLPLVKKKLGITE